MPIDVLKSGYIRGSFFIALNIQIQPSRIQGTISAPPSKSIAQRAFAAALIRKGKTIIKNAGYSADELAVLNVLEEAGCMVERNGPTVVIDSSQAGTTITNISFGESGLAARMLMPILALQENEITFTSTGSLLNRPMVFLTDALAQLGINILYTKGHLPVTVKGPLVPKNIIVDGSVSSQSVTGLIMAFVAAGAYDITLTVTNPVSKPYLALTLKVLEDMKLPAPDSKGDYASFHFKKKTISPAPMEYAIEGDWSNAAFLMVAGALAGNVRITGLDVFTAQGDKAVLQALMDAGVRLSITADYIDVAPAALKAFHFNATDMPDLFPPLAVLAAYATTGTSVIEGVHRLRDKESNRAITLQEELGRMGIKITFQDDMMLIEGGVQPVGATVDSRGDHRIAMACAIAALKAAGPTMITNASAIKKSYPHFFTDMQSLGASISGL